MLVRDVDIRIVIATHTGYIELDGYRAIRERLLTEVEIPALDKPENAIATILQKRIDVTEIGGDRHRRLQRRGPRASRCRVRPQPSQHPPRPQRLRHRTRADRADLPGPAHRRPSARRLGRVERIGLTRVPKLSGPGTNGARSALHHQWDVDRLRQLGIIRE